MNQGRWRRIEELCHAAASREGKARATFLDEACGGDDELRQEVESLLADESGAERFLVTPEWPAAGALAGTTNAAKSLWKIIPVFAVVAARAPPLVADQTRITAPLAGELLTVCNAPDVMMEGEIASVASPVVSEMSAVMTNCCRRPVL